MKHEGGISEVELARWIKKFKKMHVVSYLNYDMKEEDWIACTSILGRFGIQTPSDKVEALMKTRGVIKEVKIGLIARMLA